MQFAFIEDLSEPIVERYSITKFPKLLLLTYNYSTSTFDRHFYWGP